MGKCRISILLLSAGLLLQASAQTFNKRFDLFGEMRAQTAWGVEVRDDGSALIILNGSYLQDSLLFSSGLSSVLVAPDGTFSEGYRLHIPGVATYPGWANTTSPLMQGGYMVGGVTALPMDSSKATIFWLDEFGHVYNHRQIDLPGAAWNGRGGMQCSDGGFLVVGETVTNTEMDAFAVKTDPQGEVEWYQTYGEPGLNESLTSIVPAPWGGYYIGGSRETSTWIWEPWIVRVDELGNLIGAGDYGTIYNETPNAQLTLASDGNVLVAGGLNIENSPDGLKSCLYKVDASGDVIWQHLYGPVSRVGLLVVQEISNSTDLIAAGFDDRSNLAGPIQGILLRTTATGDSLWMRSYAYHDSLVELGNAGFYDMQPTPDGGFLAVGFAMSEWQQGPSGWEQIYSRDVWVVKTDSMGCLEPGCHLITGMETQITNLGGVLNVWPNPVAAGSQVQVEVELPESFVVQGALRLTVTDAAGRLVHEQQLRGPAGQLTTDNWQPGVHHLHLHDNTRWIAGAKLVVQ